MKIKLLTTIHIHTLICPLNEVTETWTVLLVVQRKSWKGPGPGLWNSGWAYLDSEGWGVRSKNALAVPQGEIPCDSVKGWIVLQKRNVETHDGHIYVTKFDWAQIKYDFWVHFRNQWTKTDWNGKFNSDDHYIYNCGQESLRRNGVALIVNRRDQNAVLECYLKNDRTLLFVSKTNQSISQ